MSNFESPPVAVLGLWGRVLGVRLSDGELVWEHTITPGQISVEVLVHRDRVFAACHNALHCFEYPGGKHIGKVQLPGGMFGTRTTMLIQNDVCLVAHAGRLSCLDLNGKILWHNELKGKGMGSAAIAVPGHARQADESS